MDYKVSKGNIPIDKNKLNKYKSVREIFDNEQDSDEIVIDDIMIFNKNDIDIMKIADIKLLGKLLFENYCKIKCFYNKDNKILVNKTGIDESITKIFESREQRILLYEHLVIISNLKLIIEKSKLVNQCLEIKGRNKYNHWNYYICKLKINNNSYLFEFEVVSMKNGENHYRVQNLKIIDNKKTEISTGSIINTLPVSEISVSDNNIPQK